MIANYHTHTFRCNHASGTEEEYVRNAIDRGIKVLGFSDHTPYVFEGDHYSYFRMRPELLEDYVSSVLALREKYKYEIEIHLGVEIEYYPKYLPETLKMLREYPIEYLILGQHFVGNEIGEPYCGRASDSEELLERYVDQCIEALRTGMFTYLAHPDLLFFVGDDDIYCKHMQRLCAAAKELDMPLELNLLGLKDGRNYPNELFWEIAAAEGCKAILGCDAHSPEALSDIIVEKKARALAEKVGIEIIDTVELKKF
ncbi:MAG: histidinol-phosphatase [Clostridia bacterium]|nr:histidinol-phosphatase [Clostridia bacterium]